MNDERRHFQRLTLPEPLDGWFGDFPVRLIDVSASGALVESEEPLPSEARAILRFWWSGHELEITAETVRRDHARTGLRFIDGSEMLCEMIAESASELLRAYEANARGERDQNVFGDETITAALKRHGTGYVTWIFGENGWTSRYSLLADQPEDGFTIAAGEPDEQVEILCRTYESGDSEARRLTRMLAEISVASSS